MLALRDAFRAAKPHRVGRTVFCLSQLWSRGGLQPEDKEELRNSKAPHYPARTVRFSQSTHARPLASLITVKLVGLWLDLLRSSPLKCSQHRKQLSPSSRWDVLSISHCSYEARTLVRTDSDALTPPPAASGNPRTNGSITANFISICITSRGSSLRGRRQEGQPWTVRADPGGRS